MFTVNMSIINMGGGEMSFRHGSRQDALKTWKTDESEMLCGDAMTN